MLTVFEHTKNCTNRRSIDVSYTQKFGNWSELEIFSIPFSFRFWCSISTDILIIGENKSIILSTYIRTFWPFIGEFKWWVSLCSISFRVAEHFLLYRQSTSGFGTQLRDYKRDPTINILVSQDLWKVGIYRHRACKPSGKNEVSSKLEDS